MNGFWKPQKWRFGSDDFPFQLGDFLVQHVNVPGSSHKSGEEAEFLFGFETGGISKRKIAQMKNIYTHPKSNIATKNSGLENVFSFKDGYFGILCQISGVPPW